jgi:hypothetical protein
MHHSTTSKITHQAQGPSSSPVPLTPQSSWSFLSEIPAPPGRRGCDTIGMEKSNEANGICMPMLSPTLLSPTLADTPILRPRLSSLTSEGTHDYSFLSVSLCYPRFPSLGTCCPSPTALDDEISMSDDSIHESFSDCFIASEVSFEGTFRKDSTQWACPLPSMMNGVDQGVRLQPRCLPLPPTFESRGKSFPPHPLPPTFESREKSFPPLMPMDL